MARRNLDSEFFKKPFIRSLSPDHKLFYLYVICDCNHAGIWIPDFEVASLYLGKKIDPVKTAEAFRDHMIIIDNGRWFFPDIIKKQYPNGFSSQNNAVQSARKILSNYGLLDDDNQLITKNNSAPDQGLPRGSSAHNEIEDEIEDEVEKKKTREKWKARPQNVKMVTDHFKELGVIDAEAKADEFFNFYKAKGWKIGKSAMKDWKACVKTWKLPMKQGGNKYDKLRTEKPQR